MTSRLEDLHIKGTLSADNFTPPAGSIGNEAWKQGDYLSGLKSQHGLRQLYQQESGTTAAAETRVIHAAIASGKLMQFEAGAVTANQGDATVTVDLLKNGSSVLSSAIQLSSSEANRELVEATISDDAIADGDVFEVDVTVSAGTGTLAKGVFANLIGREDPQ